MGEAYVYVLYMDGHYKIGRSQYPGAREASFRCTSPYACHCMVSIETKIPKELESHLHAVFDSKRVRGEWFILDNTDLDILYSIDNVNSLDDLPASLSLPTGDKDKTLRLIGVRLPDDLAEVARECACYYGKPLASYLADLLAKPLRAIYRQLPPKS